MYNTQRWDLPDGYTGTLKSHQSPDLCFQMDDIDKDPKLQNCADAEPRQAFQWTGDGLLHVDGECGSPELAVPYRTGLTTQVNVSP